MTLPDFDAWWDYQNPDETEQKFQELLSNPEVPEHKSYHCQLLTQIARTQGLQRKFEQAHQTLDQAQQLIDHPNSVGKVRYLLERGRVFRSSGNPDEARPLFFEAWELGSQIKEDFHAIDAAHMMTFVEPPEKQMEWNLKALDRVEQTDSDKAKRWAGSLYNNIGWTYHDSGEFEKALELFQKALEYMKQRQDTHRIHIAKWCVARALRSLEKIEESLEIQKLLLKDIESETVTDSGYVHEELGECLWLLDRKDEARKYFTLAYATMSQDVWMVENESERLERIQQLSQTSSQ